MEKARRVEKSIIKTYRKPIWSKFVKAIKEFDLVQEGDKIAVCISGGKDSMLLAKCFQELKRHGVYKFDLEFISMNPGFNDENLKMIVDNSEKLGIPVNIFNSDIFEIIEKHAKDEPCYLCARMRRGHLYAKAKELGCNKIALGHHFDDVIETIMLNIFYNGSHQTMMPRVESKNFDEISLIRPLYFVEETNINKWKNYNDLQFMNCGCVVTSGCVTSKRAEIKSLIRDLEKINPYIKKNIYKSSENVNLDALIAYKKDNKKHHFLDNEDE